MPKPNPKRLEDLMFDLSSILPTAADETQSETGNLPNEDKHVVCKPTINRHHMRRITSELALEQELPWHFEQGVSYHNISFGDVDALSYVRCIVKQQRVRYMIISTWVTYIEDVRELREWLEKGYIGRIDFYVGEILRASRPAEYAALIRMCKDFGGRFCVFRNHAKVTVVIGERFDAVIESSANLNGTPRTEQTCITVDSELAAWYKEFFDGIKSFERDFDDVQPWQPES